MSVEDDWVDALAGRSAADSPATRDAKRLRQALQKNLHSLAAAESPASLAREEQLLAAARLAGLLPRHERSSWSRAWALAASVVVVSLGATWWFTQPRETYVVRGTANGVTTVAVADAAVSQADLLAALRQLQIDCQGYEMFGRYAVDATLPLPPSNELIAVLTRFGLTLPADGALRVEFVTASP